MFKNTASQKCIVFAFDATTNIPKTGDAANLTAYVSKDYGAVTVLGDTSATEMDATNAPGYYLFDLTQAETNADVLLISGKSATANIKLIGAPAVIYTRPPNAGALSIDSNGRVDVIKVAGTTQTAGDIPVRLPAALVGGRMDSSIGAVAANAITAAGIADGAIDRATFAADTGLQSIRSGTAQAGAASTITLDVGASAVDSFYNNTAILLTGGTGAGQLRTISGYVGATKVATISSAWLTNPDNTTTFAIFSDCSTSADTATAVMAAMNSTTFAEPAQGTPAATASLVTKIGFLYKAWRNRSSQTATAYKLYNDDATTVDHKATVSDDGTTFESAEKATGP